MLVGNKFSFCFVKRKIFNNRKSHCGISLFVSLQLNGATYKSETKFSGGGVGRNIAEGLQNLYGNVSFISAFGTDQNGDFLRKTLPAGATRGSIISDRQTASCAIILDKRGDCKLCVGDMTIHGEITPDLVSESQTCQDIKKSSKIHETFFFRFTKVLLSLSAPRLFVLIRTFHLKRSKPHCCWRSVSENQVRLTSISTISPVILNKYLP